jgi:hypothetical protein
MLADDPGRHPRHHAPVRDLAPDHGAGRDHHVAADVRAGQDDRPRAQPGAGPDADRAVGGSLVPDRGAGILVAVVLVGDVDVRAGPHVVFQGDRLVRDDVAAPADHAAVADREQGQPPEVLAGQGARAQRDKLADERAHPDLYPVLAEDGAGRERHDRPFAEGLERPPGRRVGGHQAGLLELSPSPVHGPPERVALRGGNPTAKPHPPRHGPILPCASAPGTTAAGRLGQGEQAGARAAGCRADRPARYRCR